MTQRWREAGYLIELAAAFKMESHERRTALAANPDDFAKWVDAVPKQGYRQFRNILVHLAFPDEFERITVDSHKRQIAKAFGGLTAGKLKTATEMSWTLPCAICARHSWPTRERRISIFTTTPWSRSGKTATTRSRHRRAPGS
jgi:hypothetical protein